MPIPYTLQDPFQLDGMTKFTINEQERRNSLVSAMSAFEFSTFPGMPQRHDPEDIDPFAPLSLDDDFHTTKFSSQQHYRDSHDRVLTDRSESSGTSDPSLTSSATGSQSSSFDRQQQARLLLQETSPAYAHCFDDTPYEAFSYPPSTSSTSFSSTSVDSVFDEADEEDDGADSQRFKRFHEEKWSHRYKELLIFHRQFGHSAVPHTFPSNPQLARWVKRQRRQYKLRRDGRQSTMTVERLQLLDTVGFVWDSHDVNWREKLAALDDFRRGLGHCNVPSNYSDKKLATWVKCQRRQYKLYIDQKPSAMTEQRINELEKRGFEWEIRSSSSKTKTAAADFATTY